MNIFITGNRNCGKSTLIKSILDKLDKSISGFESRPYFENGIRKGFIFHSIADVKENDKIISIGKCGNTEVFETLGVECLEKSLSDSSETIVMDEIGRFESEANMFLSMIDKCLDNEKAVIGVLKKENIPHIEKIKNRNDVIVFDLDTEDKNIIQKDIIRLIKEKTK